jgi:NTP pyrophosphatase (non-canonical NTP hydrolase)
MEKILNRITILSKNDKKSTFEKCVKIQEEVGELSAEFLKLRGKKGAKGLSKEEIKRNILEECCDIIIITYSLLKSAKYSNESIKKAFHRKLDKAKSNIMKQASWKKNV